MSVVIRVDMTDGPWFFEVTPGGTLEKRGPGLV